MDDRQISPDSSTHTKPKSKGHKRKSNKSHKKGSKKKHRSKSFERSPSPNKESIIEWLNTPEDQLPTHLKEVCLDVKSLKDYLPDKTELHKQLFKLTNKKTFKKLLPPILNNYDAKEVRSWCLAELKTMSKKRIRYAINDEEMLSSSSSEDESLISSSPDNQMKANDNFAHIDNATSDTVMENSAGYSKIVNIEENVNDSIDGLSLSPVKEDIDAFLNETNLDEAAHGQHLPSVDTHHQDNIVMSKTEMEDTLTVLEMELRARALQSLLKRKT